jgi:CRP/FNR family transcriptional regulator, anaerobic regulatory protein
LIQVTRESNVLAPATNPYESLPAGHPCEGCEVRYRAICGVLGCKDLARFKSLGRTLTLAAGQTLFHEGDPADRVFTLTKGTLKLYRLLPDGRRHVTGFIHPGDFLGMSGDEEHGSSAEALEKAQLCWFPRNRFDNFVSDRSAMEHNLYRLATHELSAAQKQMLLLARKTATERVASFLISLAERPGSADRASRLVRLPMSRSDIADYLGLTKETVSRVLSALKCRGLIRLRATDRIEIVDYKQLAATAECDSSSR